MKFSQKVAWHYAKHWLLLVHHSNDTLYLEHENVMQVMKKAKELR